MQPNQSKHTDKAWAEVFGNAIRKPKEPQGPGWMTFNEIVAHFRVGSTKARLLLKSMVKGGQMERFRGIQIKDSKSKSQVWYRPSGLGVKTR